jgi:hypothetical protein
VSNNRETGLMGKDTKSDRSKSSAGSLSHLLSNCIGTGQGQRHVRGAVAILILHLNRPLPEVALVQLKDEQCSIIGDT